MFEYAIFDTSEKLSELEKMPINVETIIDEESVYIDLFEDGYYDKSDDDTLMPSTSIGVWRSNGMIKINIAGRASEDPQIEVWVDKTGEVNVVRL